MKKYDIAILLYRANYPSFDQFANHIILLEEAMIYGRSGDIEKASELFNKHYQNALVEYKADFENGIQTYLRKGERLVYRNTKTGETETIIADKDGYVVTYSANRGHIDYIETLASELGIVLKQYKSIDDLISDAKAQSKENEAKKNMVRIPLREGRTLHHDIAGRFGAGKVYLRTAPAGTGVIAGGPMRAIFEVLGVQDVVAKSMGSNNPYNMIKATFNALEAINSPRMVAAKRGKKVGDIVSRRENSSNAKIAIEETL